MAAITDYSTMKMGDTCFMAQINSEQRTHECPDCKGTKQWLARSPAGSVLTAACPRCSGYGGLDHGSAPSLHYRHSTAKAMKVQVMLRLPKCVRY